MWNIFDQSSHRETSENFAAPKRSKEPGTSGVPPEIYKHQDPDRQKHECGQTAPFSLGVKMVHGLVSERHTFPAPKMDRITDPREYVACDRPRGKNLHIEKDNGSLAQVLVS